MMDQERLKYVKFARLKKRKNGICRSINYLNICVDEGENMGCLREASKKNVKSLLLGDLGREFFLFAPPNMLLCRSSCTPDETAP